MVCWAFVVGLLNGVAVIYFLLPILFPEPTAVIEISTAGCPEHARR